MMSSFHQTIKIQNKIKKFDEDSDFCYLISVIHNFKENFSNLFHYWNSTSKSHKKYHASLNFLNLRDASSFCYY